MFHLKCQRNYCKFLLASSVPIFLMHKELVIVGGKLQRAVAITSQKQRRQLEQPYSKLC